MRPPFRDSSSAPSSSPSSAAWIGWGLSVAALIAFATFGGATVETAEAEKTVAAVAPQHSAPGPRITDANWRNERFATPPTVVVFSEPVYMHELVSPRIYEQLDGIAVGKVRHRTTLASEERK